MKRALSVLLLCASMTARADLLPAGNSDVTMRKFVELAGMSMLYQSGRLSGYYTRSVEVNRDMTLEQKRHALDLALEGSGLFVDHFADPGNWISVRPIAVKQPRRVAKASRVLRYQCTGLPGPWAWQDGELVYEEGCRHFNGIILHRIS